jgi:hypothetical protein
MICDAAKNGGHCMDLLYPEQRANNKKSHGAAKEWLNEGGGHYGPGAGSTN